MATSRLGLIEFSENDLYNTDQVCNDNWNKIDSAFAYLESIITTNLGSNRAGSATVMADGTAQTASGTAQIIEEV